MEDQIRKIVREEIARALSAAGEVADGALSTDPYQDTDAEDTALCAVNKVMERVARDVLANVHPALDPEHTASTPGTQPVHTITAVPERPRATCTCHRHTHVMGHDDRCGSPFCYCLSPVRARDEHTDVHASTEDPRTCSVCSHGEHDQGKCTMHVYLRGVASPCPCLASRTLGAQASTGARRACPTCEHATHGAGDCGYTAMCLGQVVKCMCMEWVRPEAVVRTGARRVCTLCEHAPHGAGSCGAVTGQGTPFAAPCECGGRA